MAKKKSITKSSNHNQCQSITKNGKRCGNNTLPGKSFCSIKSHSKTNVELGKRFVNFFQNNWLGFSIILLITVLGLVLAFYQIYLFYDDKSKEISTGQLSGKFVDETKPFVINVGGNTVPLTPTELKNGYDFRSSFLTITEMDGSGGSMPVKFYVENNRLLFDIAIYNTKGKLVCNVVRNQWQFFNSGLYDRNYSNDAFEIVDADKIPVFQILLKGNNQIELAGYVPLSDGFYNVFSPEGMRMRANKTELISLSKRIFKYPSSEYLGQFEIKNPDGDQKFQPFK